MCNAKNVTIFKKHIEKTLIQISHLKSTHQSNKTQNTTPLNSSKKKEFKIMEMK